MIIDLHTHINNYHEDRVTTISFNSMNTFEPDYRNLLNSIPDYIPVEGFQAMVDAVKEIRRREGKR